MAFGVYKIENIVNGKVYIGATIQSFEKRWIHRSVLKVRRHYNQYLQEDWDKYGEEQFVFSILEELKNKRTVVISEQRWIKFFGTKGQIYNIKLSAFIPPIRASSEIRRNQGKRSTKASDENRIITFDEIRQVARTFFMNIESVENNIIMKHHDDVINIYYIADMRKMPE